MAQAFLQVDERVKLNNIVSGLYDWEEGTRGRRFFVTNAGLSKFLAGIDLGGAPRVSAGVLLQRLETHGFLPERPNYHALGALLSYTLELGDAPPDDLNYMAGVLVKYDLVHDPAYTEELRSKYNITLTAEPLEDPAAPAVAPTPGVQSEAEILDFEPIFDNFEGLEQIIGSEDNFLDISVLAGAIYSAQAVGRIEIPEGRAIGTGFLVGPDLLLTNQHVLKNERSLEEAVIRFDYQNDLKGIISSPGRVVKIRTDFYHASPANKLDYALVRLEEEPLKEVMLEDEKEAENLLPIDLIRMGKHRGYLALAPREIRHKDRVNIIQHPNGDPLKVVMTQNHVAADMTDTRVHYIADTMGGSSGSAVFNRQWEVIALHHAGKPYPPLPAGHELPGAEKNWRDQYQVNEGIPIRAILEDLKAKRLERYLPRK